MSQNIDRHLNTSQQEAVARQKRRRTYLYGRGIVEASGVLRLYFARRSVARSTIVELMSTRTSSIPRKNTSYCNRVAPSPKRIGLDRQSSRLNREVINDFGVPSKGVRRATSGARVAAFPSTRRITTFASR